MNYGGYILKRKIEDIIMLPFIATGRLIALINPMKKEYRVWFFFPFYHIGGAEKIHAQVAQAAGGPGCVIYFTKKSHNDLFMPAFKESGCEIKDISRFTDNKWLYFLNIIYRGILSGYINRQKQVPAVFNGQCNFGYKISPWIKKDIRQVELIHSLNTFSWIRIPFIPFYRATAMISRLRIDDHKKLYEQKKIPTGYLERIQYIPNAITLPESPSANKAGPFTVLYTGRGGIEKRVHLIAAMAKKIQPVNPNIHFEFLGDVSEVLNAAEYPFIHFHGNQHDRKVIDSVYERTHVLVLTSSTEGFPVVVIEAMAHGASILCTPVGDLPQHIRQDVNGYLFSSVTDEQRIIDEGVEKILALQADLSLCRKIGETNIQYAKDNFAIDKFNEAYRSLIFLKSADHSPRTAE